MTNVIIKTFGELTNKERSKLSFLTNRAYGKPGVMLEWLKGNNSHWQDHTNSSQYLSYIPWIGWAAFHEQWELPHISCFVAPEYRKQGLGEYLVNSLLSNGAPSILKYDFVTRKWWEKVLSSQGFYMSLQSKVNPIAYWDIELMGQFWTACRRRSPQQRSN